MNALTRYLLRRATVAAALLSAVGDALAVDRFPKPDFETGHVLPSATTPLPRALFSEYTDVVILAAALGLAAWFALRTRSRRGIVVLSLFCLAYFGFWRQGCVCPVGSVQNVVLALADRSYAIPIAVLLFFLLPLVAALLVGRVFCAAVCPLGAVQDLVVIRPVKLPTWLSATLGMLPYLYLGLAVFFAATGAGFLICRYDPFVAFFRLGGSFPMLVFGAGLLILGMFVGRPYCRFLCPYGVMLGWLSRLSRRHVTITPDECINCRLCEDACPFGCIHRPTPDKAPESRATGVRRLGLLLAVLPLAVGLAAWSGARLDVLLSRMHPTVAVAEQIMAENLGRVEATTLESDTFRGSGQPVAALLAEAVAARRRFRTGGWWLGGFVGLVFGGKLIGLAVRRHRPEYEIDRDTCVSCARCFTYCPRERLRRGELQTETTTP